MIYKFSVHPTTGDGAPAHLRALVGDLRVWREYYVECRVAPGPEQLEGLRGALADPLTHRVELGVPFDRTPGAVQVSYKPGIVDNESPSILAMCGLCGIEATAAKVATAYASAGPDLASVIDRFVRNANIEDLHTSEPHYATLGVAGGYTPATTYDLAAMSDDELRATGTGDGRGLTLEQMRHLRSIQVEVGAGPVTDALLEAMNARWSDHCAHTTWTSLGNLLRRLIDAAKHTKNPNVVSMFSDNAGVWDFYGGHCIAVKAETHNGPSAVSAYFGQLTKVGGVLRDILGTGTGADPIGVFEYTATGDPATAAPTAGMPNCKQVANETIRAVKEYGNTFGVPMMSSKMSFHPAYRAKPFALGGSVGLIPSAAAERGRPLPGDLVVLLGGLTGDDGIHGASASSTTATAMDRAAVQIGAPLEQVKFREALLELRDAGCLRAVTDLGAAGLNSAVGEMGDPVGVWLNTALVPLKSEGLPMWRILVSESQERMLCAVAPERLTEARDILERHEVGESVVGFFTGNGRFCVVHDGAVGEGDIVALAAAGASPPPVAELGFDIPYELLDWAPEQRPVPPAPAGPAGPGPWPPVRADDLPALVGKVVADAEVADQSFAALQYDSTVGGRTQYGPLVGRMAGVASGYFACRPLRNRRHGLVLSTGFDPWLFDIDPVRAARQCVLSAVTTQVLAGVALEDICLCDNFYTPHLTPDGDGWLVAMVDELAQLSTRLGVPFISGKDSSSGSTMTGDGLVSVPPAVFVSALGKLPDVADLRPELWTTAGTTLVLVGPRSPAPAGTAAARALGIHPAGGLDEVDLDAAEAGLAALGRLTLAAAPSGRTLRSGGAAALAVLTSEATGLGCEFDLPGGDGAGLFFEHRCGALLEVPEHEVGRLPPELDAVVVGRVVDNGGRVTADGVRLNPPGVVAAWRNTFEEALR